MSSKYSTKQYISARYCAKQIWCKNVQAFLRYSNFRVWIYFTSDKGGRNCVYPRSFVCLSVCLLARLLKNACMIWMKCCVSTDVGTWTNRQTDYLLSPIRIIVRMPEPDCFFRYRMCCSAEFYYVGKIPRIAIGRPSLPRRVVLKWFYSPRAVGTTLSEVHALHRVPF